MKLKRIVDRTLIMGIDDWVHFAQVVDQVYLVGGARSLEEALELAILAVGQLLKSGLMVAGTLRDDGFHPWEVSPSEALLIIEREALSLGRLPEVGEICWLNSSAEADVIAQGLEWDFDD
ncbi:hypothetical protein [Streptosporangium subroseum]|uniref:hypothetical protein n=1 Tax=Streptosporangium subroseum TaxID=106412 RepID=UPI0011804244|nr:hypothetical protein [Streptosporangium subroseum]